MAVVWRTSLGPTMASVQGYGTPQESQTYSTWCTLYQDDITTTEQSVSRPSHKQETNTTLLLHYIHCWLHLSLLPSPNPTDNYKLGYSLHCTQYYLLTLYLQANRRTAGRGREGQSTLQSAGFRTPHLPSFFPFFFVHVACGIIPIPNPYALGMYREREYRHVCCCRDMVCFPFTENVLQIGWRPVQRNQFSSGKLMYGGSICASENIIKFQLADR